MLLFAKTHLLTELAVLLLQLVNAITLVLQLTGQVGELFAQLALCLARLLFDLPIVKKQLFNFLFKFSLLLHCLITLYRQFLLFVLRIMWLGQSDPLWNVIIVTHYVMWQHEQAAMPLPLIKIWNTRACVEYSSSFLMQSIVDEFTFCSPFNISWSFRLWCCSSTFSVASSSNFDFWFVTWNFRSCNSRVELPPLRFRVELRF